MPQVCSFPAPGAQAADLQYGQSETVRLMTSSSAYDKYKRPNTAFCCSFRTAFSRRSTTDPDDVSLQVRHRVWENNTMRSQGVDVLCTKVTVRFRFGEVWAL